MVHRLISFLLAQFLLCNVFFLHAQHVLPKYFHTTDEIHDQLQTLAKTCQLNMMIDSYKIKQSINPSEDYFLDIVTISRRVGTVEPRKLFFVFGEHARELISVESGFFFIQKLCRSENFFQQLTSTDHKGNSFEIQVVVNANPVSRKRVEQGEYCLRTNENGVDLNRNWLYNWKPAKNRGQSTYPGDRPFSEVETQLVRDALIKFKSQTFVSVHSGTCAYMSPNSQSTEDVDISAVAQKKKKILHSFSRVGLPCVAGEVSSVLGYDTEGNSMDFAAHVLKIPYSFGFEIYKANPTSHVSRFGKRMIPYMYAGYEDNSLDTSLKVKSLTSGADCCTGPRYGFLRKRTIIESADCFKRFNPSSLSVFRWTLRSWNRVYLSLITEMLKEAYVSLP